MYKGSRDTHRSVPINGPPQQRHPVTKRMCTSHSDPAASPIGREKPGTFPSSEVTSIVDMLLLVAMNMDILVVHAILCSCQDPKTGRRHLWHCLKSRCRFRDRRWGCTCSQWCYRRHTDSYFARKRDTFDTGSRLITPSK